MEFDEVISKLRTYHNPKNVEGMAHFGINPANTLGVSVPTLRAMAREIGTNHNLAQRLWDSGIHEARILTTMIDDPEKVTPRQMDKWVKDFDSWDVCDQCCSNLFDKTKWATQKAIQWASSREEFVKRAGFVLMATLAVHDKKAINAQFQRYLPIIKRESTDERNFVKKAVNWALRQIGKRNLALNRYAIEAARQIERKDSATARWIAKDALRELKSQSVRSRFKKRTAQ
jgi:3-methyladenine DNA glycosylase AlkD